MSALAQLKDHEDASLPDPELLRAAVAASLEGLAIIERSHDGGPSHIRLSSASFRIRGTDFEIVSAHQVTQQKRLERKLREAEKMEAVGRLVGGVAHDFNNLLTAIMLYCDLLVAGLSEDRRSLHHAEEIRMAGEHGAALVRQLMAVARPQVEEPRELGLNVVISNMRGLLERLIGENIHLTTSLDDDIGLIQMGPAQMQQIVLNLVLNARDAMPEGGQLRVASRNCTAVLPDADPVTGRSTQCVELIVSDTGCGMDAETQAHLFQRFFTTKPPGRGHGLGLATVASMVQQHGGTIRVTSQVGTGTQVTVLWPRAGDVCHQISMEQ